MLSSTAFSDGLALSRTRALGVSRAKTIYWIRSTGCGGSFQSLAGAPPTITATGSDTITCTDLTPVTCGANALCCTDLGCRIAAAHAARGNEVITTTHGWTAQNLCRSFIATAEWQSATAGITIGIFDQNPNAPFDMGAYYNLNVISLVTRDTSGVVLSYQKTTSWVSGTEHEVSWCTNKIGGSFVAIDGVPATMVTAGSGTGVMDSFLDARLGYEGIAVGKYLEGYLKAYRVCTGTTNPLECRP